MVEEISTKATLEQEAITSLLTQSIDDDDDDDETRLTILHDWANEKHIWIHNDIIIGRIKDIEHNTQAKGKGYGVFLRKDSEPIIDRQILILVPKRSILSARTSSLSELIDDDLLFSHDASAGLLLSTILLHEFLLGDRSPWWGYLQSMPRSKRQSDGSKKQWGIELPMHWKEERENECWHWIEHCESGRIVKRAIDDPDGILEGIGMSLVRLKRYFDQNVLSILSKAHPHLSIDEISTKTKLWNDFVGMHSLISSRSFVVDMFHGLALVPVSDMFNHSDDANVHFEADEDVCDECGELGMCPHNDDPLPSSAYGRPSAFLPAERGPNSIDWKAPEWLNGLDTVDMVAQEQIDQSKEAFNTYGLMSNSILLTTYGFCLDEETEWERYGWEWRNEEEMKEVCAAFKLQKDSKKRCLEGNGAGFKSQKDSKERFLEDNDSDQKGEYASTIYDRWIKACINFTNLSLESIAELYSSPIELIRNQKNKSEPGAALLSMPITSPFTAFMRSVYSADLEDEPIMGEQKLNSSLQTFLSPLSTHDGSRDRYQPLFIDKEGQISLPLFRIAILSAYVNDSDHSLSEVKMIGEAEKLLNQIILASESDGKLNISEWSLSVIKILKETLQLLLTLVQSRKTKLYISHENRQEEALKIIESSKHYCLRSAVLQAFQEGKALDITIDRLHSYIHYLELCTRRM